MGRHDKAFHCEEYRQWRLSVTERDQYRCRMCGSTGRRHTFPLALPLLSAHHIYPKRKYPDLIYCVDNGITLCGVCHDEVTRDELSYVERLMGIIGSSVKAVMESESVIEGKLDALVLTLQENSRQRMRDKVWNPKKRHQKVSGV